jgi:hypothetical protein
MDIRLKRKIANDFPYPITVDFMRLNTMEYKNPGDTRLRKIIDVTEMLLQFLSLISISDLVENVIKKEIEIPPEFRKAFRNNFTQPTMGKWVELLRETIKIFKSQNKSMFIEELADFFVKSVSSETKVQQAFNKIVSIRNQLNHKSQHYNKADIIKTCNDADTSLEFILKELDFIIDYQFLYINKVTVEYHRWSDPVYNVDMSYIVGSNPELFDSTNSDDNHKNIMHTPAIVITKGSTNQYLNLEPLIIYSDEGNMEITDIFMYMGWDKSRNKITFKPVWKGGEFNLINTSLKNHLTPELLKIFKLLASESDYLSFKSEYSKDLNLVYD